MSIGLTNAVSAFMNLMNYVFIPYLDSFFIVFMDDILKDLWIREEHEQRLRIMIHTLRDHKLFSKFSKYKLWIKFCYIPRTCGV